MWLPVAKRSEQRETLLRTGSMSALVFSCQRKSRCEKSAHYKLASLCESGAESLLTGRSIPHFRADHSRCADSIASRFTR
jgi:hypothetical protein